jgi:hypothetical protein
MSGLLVEVICLLSCLITGGKDRLRLNLLIVANDSDSMKILTEDLMSKHVVRMVNWYWKMVIF